MKKKLKDLGYKERHIKKMSAEKAHLLVNNQIKAPKEVKKSSIKHHDTIILDSSTDTHNNINKKE